MRQLHYHPVQTKIGKYTLKQLNILRKIVVRDIKIREKKAITDEAQRDFLKTNRFVNPKYALKQLDIMIFAFEHTLRWADESWVRNQLIRKEVEKAGFDMDEYVEHKPEIDKIVTKIDIEMDKKQKKGFKLFARHFPDLFILEHYSKG